MTYLERAQRDGHAKMTAKDKKQRITYTAVNHSEMSNLLIATENARQAINGTTCRSNRAEIGQFLTPAPIAHFMASLFEKNVAQVRILDAGAGVGTLFAASVQMFCSREPKPKSIEVVPFENDANVLPYLNETIEFCRNLCVQAGVDFIGNVRHEDFISSALEQLEETLFTTRERIKFTHAILNPPYKKINAQSEIRKMLNAAGLGSSNLYTAFVWLSMKMLEPDGELVAITPRSFCNGPYFRKFRKDFLESTNLQRIHIFESREKAFSGDAVLQENVIFHALRDYSNPKRVTISSTVAADFSRIKTKLVPYENVVLPRDPDMFIHLVQSEKDQQVMERMNCLACRLEELDLEVSTGRVVDFRARDFLRQQPSKNTVPLIYPCHLQDGFVEWPKVGGKKPNAIVSCSETANLLVPSGHYVLTKRFTAKEERRRVVASIFEPQRFGAKFVGFENHLNYFHVKGNGLSANMANGLALFLNSTLFDAYFRLFSGHTQVNATDLRKMRYPSREELLRLSAHVKKQIPKQELIDRIIEKELGCDE